MAVTITFPSKWVDAATLEKTLRTFPGPHESQDTNIEFVIPAGSKIMIDASTRLLSLLNQLEDTSKRVRLIFEEGETGVMGYLNRMGFFDNLDDRVDVKPPRPKYSGAEVYGGMNTGLVEIARIDHKKKDKALPTRLTDALRNGCKHRADVEELGGAAWTIFAELIDNIFSHSETKLDGYAALQVYKQGKTAKVAVSDSGLGIMETLRPALKQAAPKLAILPEVDLLVEIFRQGLSRHGNDRGCGLKGSAAKAVKFKAELDIRLPNSRVLLVPGLQGYRPNTAYSYSSLPLIWGTHICFTFPLTQAQSSG